MKVVLVLVYKKVTHDHDGYCSDSSNYRTITTTYRKTMNLPDSFSPDEYFDVSEFDGDKVEVPVEDPRLVEYQKVEFGGECSLCMTTSWLKKAFLTTKSF